MRLKILGPNQALVIVESRQRIELFYSYETPVAAYIEGKHYRTAKYWSRTTTKHMDSWLGNEIYQTKPQEFFDRIANQITVEGEIE